MSFISVRGSGFGDTISPCVKHWLAHSTNQQKVRLAPWAIHAVLTTLLRWVSEVIRRAWAIESN
jgi:hypothetical protein